MGTPLPPPLTSCRGHQEVASGRQCRPVIWKWGLQIKEGLTSWEGAYETTLVFNTLGHKMDFPEQTLGAMPLYT